jgi:hypothetical protein
MERDEFWNIIDDAGESADDAEETAEAVVERLQSKTPKEIIAFAQTLTDIMKESYRWDLWAVAYIINGGCSDDGFEYFRAWLIAQGRERYDAALANPEVIGDWAEPDECECEELMGAGWDAYLAKTGNEFPDGAIHVDYPDDPIGESWKEDDLEERYPALSEKFA